MSYFDMTHGVGIVRFGEDMLALLATTTIVPRIELVHIPKTLLTPSGDIYFSTHTHSTWTIVQQRKGLPFVVVIIPTDTVVIYAVVI